MRALAWPGLRNARDLGGLPTPSGPTRTGVFVRAADPRQLEPEGWDALRAHRIASIVSLYTRGMRGDEYDAADARADFESHGVSAARVWIEDAGDAEFQRLWVDTGLFGTPLYYLDALVRWPDQHARVLAALAESPEGALFHCREGFDRTGLIAMLVLDAAGVEPDAIVEDYLASFAVLAVTDPAGAESRRRLLARAGTSAADAAGAAVRGLGSAFWSRAAGAGELRDAIRAKLAPA